MNKIKYFFTNIYDYFSGWIAALKYQESNYKYVIDTIELNTIESQPSTIIHYKLIGCRASLYQAATHLNNSHLFSLFRPDHAQMIVSIATLEALIHKNPNQILERYQHYLQQCIAQFAGK